MNQLGSDGERGTISGRTYQILDGDVVGVSSHLELNLHRYVAEVLAETPLVPQLGRLQALRRHTKNEERDGRVSA